MANWVKGKLKIRGKPEDIKRWVEECLHCYFTKWFRDGSYEDELVDDAVVFEKSECNGMPNKRLEISLNFMV